MTRGEISDRKIVKEMTAFSFKVKDNMDSVLIIAITDFWN